VPEEPLGIPNNEVLSPVEEPCAFTMVQRLGTREKSNEIHDLYAYESNNTMNVGFHTRKATKTKPEQTEKKTNTKNNKEKTKKTNQKLGDTQVLLFIIFCFSGILPVSFFPECGFPFHSGGLGAECVFA
jgi:hypothetical protein